MQNFLADKALLPCYKVVLINLLRRNRNLIQKSFNIFPFSLPLHCLQISWVICRFCYVRLVRASDTVIENFFCTVNDTLAVLLWGDCAWRASHSAHIYRHPFMHYVNPLHCTECRYSRPLWFKGMEFLLSTYKKDYKSCQIKIHKWRKQVYF